MPGNHPGNSYNVVTAPIDKRPISLEYLLSLVKMGGDNFYTVDKSYLDQGPTSPTAFAFGNSTGVQNDISSLISTRNAFSTIGIINTTSYMLGGLVASRMPDRYNLVSNGLNALDSLTNTYTNPYYYVHVPMPRTLPDPRFPWLSITDKGMAYYYWGYKFREDLQSLTDFSQLLAEWGYVSHKELSGYPLESWENDFKTYFENKYFFYPISEYKYNGVSYAAWYKNLYSDAKDLIKELMTRQKNGQINELVVGIDDIKLPDFYTGKDIYTEAWVPRDANNNPIKFSWALHNLYACKLHHESLYSPLSVTLGEKGDSSVINYLAGVDEIPQLIYAHDITRRTGFATKLQIDYSLDRDPEASRTYQAPFDLFSTEEIIEQRRYFVRKRGFEAGTARTFRVFIHNWDKYDAVLAQNMFNENASGNPEQAAIDYAIAVYNSFNNNENVGILDLGTNEVDWELYRALGMITGYIRTQLACYSGWNTVGNAVGLGLAHAQVFGMLDYYDATRGMWSYHANVIAQHLLEDGIYNTKIKGNPNLEQSQLTGFMEPSEHFNIARDTWDRLKRYDANPDNPGGDAYVMQYLTNSNFPMRLAGNNYTWNSAYVKPSSNPTSSDLYNVTGHPWNRTFECIVSTYIW